MNKGGFVKILQHGRKTIVGQRRFSSDWIDRKKGVINKKERVSCCYAKFYKGVRDDETTMILHCIKDEHIIKLVAKIGFDERLIREVRYYTSKILDGS